MAPPTTVRAVEQPTLFGAVEPEGSPSHRLRRTEQRCDSEESRIEHKDLSCESQARGAESEPGAPLPGDLARSAAPGGGGDETDLRPAQRTTFHAVSPLSNLLHEVCAYCGKEIQLPGFVIPDFEDLGAFCNEACGDGRFRLFLDEGPD